MPILEWFRMKFQELKEKLDVSHTLKEESRQKRGLRL
jgi:mobilization protein